MSYLRRILPYLRPYWWLAAVIGVLIVLGGLTGLLAPWPLKILVDNVLGREPLPPVVEAIFGGQANKIALLIATVVAGLLVVLADSGLRVLDNYFQTTLENRMVLDFRSELFQHAQRLSLAFHDQKRSGMLIYAINFQGDAVAGLFMMVPAVLQNLFTLVGMFWIVFLMDARLALLSTLVIPFLFFSVRYYATHIQARLLEVRGMEGESLSIIHEAISMLRVIVAFGREPHEYRRFREQGKQAVGARVNVTVRQTLFSLAVNMTTAVGTAAVLGFGAYQSLQGKLTVGDLLVVMAYIAAVYKPLEAITYSLGALQEKLMSLRIAFDLLDTQPEVVEPHHPVAIERAQGRITFDRVDFSYQGRLDTLKQISFDIEPGQRVAIVGPTGAGKTTLVSLIPRFYDTTRGQITLDGHDIRSLSLKSLRAQISMVLQEPLLFSGTIRENIRYGRLESTDLEVTEAARAANAHDFIMQLPDQYDTELGERGAKLSGGERQRICIARAFLKDAPVLILDEPTSSIDSRTEAIVLEALDRLLVGRTGILIAHRLSTIHQADLILVVDGGRLVQCGTHEELLSRDGLFRQLYESQHRHPRSRLAKAGHQVYGAL